MPITSNQPKSMKPAKKPASKRKVTRRAPESPKAPKSDLQTLQTPCRPRPKSTASAERMSDEDFKRTIAYAVFESRAWPRYFELPGLAGVKSYTSEDVLYLFGRVLDEWSDELHALAARAAHDHPNKAAELAEVLAITEQLQCAGGLATELDEIFVGGVSPRLLLAALAKQQAHVKRPLASEAARHQRGGKVRP